MKKRFMSILLISLMAAASLSGCGGNKDNEEMCIRDR